MLLFFDIHSRDQAGAVEIDLNAWRCCFEAEAAARPERAASARTKTGVSEQTIGCRAALGFVEEQHC